MIDHHIRLEVPIFDLTIHLVLSEDIFAARRNLSRLFGPPPSEDYSALVSANDNMHYAMLLHPRALEDLATVSHEMFHLTHRIMDERGFKFDIDNHEAFAQMHGYLTRVIYAHLGISFTCKLLEKPPGTASPAPAGP